MNTLLVNSDDLKTLIEEVQALRVEVRSLRTRLGEPLFTIEDAARELNYNRRTITRMIEDGRLNPVNKKGHPRFTFEEIKRAKRNI